MENVIEEFSAKAPDLQLSDLLNTVRQGYENQLGKHDETIELLGSKKLHPQKFENEIHEIKRLLAEYKLSMNKFVERTQTKYTGRSTSFRNKLNQLRCEYDGRIEESENSNGIRKTLADFGAANQSFLDSIAAEIRQDYVDELARKGEQFKADYAIVVPKVDLAGIEEKAETEAYREAEMERDPEGWHEWVLKFVSLGFMEFKERKKVFDEDLYVRNYRALAGQIIEVTVGKDGGLVSGLVGKFNKSFLRAMESLIASRTRELEDLRVRKSTNDEILKEIEEATSKKKAVASELSRVDEMLEDLR